MKFGFYTLGCKVNQYETQALEQMVLNDGHTITQFDADIFIINSCTVTSASDKKNIKVVNKIKKDNPNAIIAMCGCFSQTSPEKVAPYVDVVCGTDNRLKVIELSIEAFNNKTKIDTVKKIENMDFELMPAGNLNGRTRALLKVQDGCDYFCSYCIIPYARGRVKSMPMDFALNEVNRLTDVLEIVITGIEISSYGKDIGGNIVELTENILKSTPGKRIRMGSLEPRVITQEFCEVLSKYENFCPHFHLSMQSGCDKILKKMNRKYTTNEFFSKTQLLRRYFKNPAITTDLIVGFPDETDDDFKETLEFIKKCNFSSMHIFPFSIRKGTVAAKMDNQIDIHIKNKRAEIAGNVAYEMEQKYLRSFVGEVENVLVEREKDGYMKGHTNKHFMIKFKSDINYKNQIVSIKIMDVLPDNTVLGEII